MSSQLDYRLSLERGLASKAEEMLERVLGPGRAIVRVTAHVNFQRLKETRETYDPEGRVITTEKVTAMKSGSSGSGTRGAAGATSNLPSTGRGTSGSGGTSSSTTNEETTETGYAVSRTVQEMEDKIGGLERLTVAALVDLSGGSSADGQARPTLSVADVTDLIKQAVGFKADRDEIKVSDVRLTGPDTKTETDETGDRWQQWRLIADIVRQGSLGGAIIIASVMAWLTLRQFRPPPVVPTPSPTPKPAPNPSWERVSTLARQDPEAVARVLATWLEQKNGNGRGVAA
jgi:flagellar M-ring protein FliF